jgi:hypothetical protein
MATDTNKDKKHAPHSHAAFGYKREGRRWGRLLNCGTGYLDMAERSLEDIAAEFEGVPVDVDVVRQILDTATAHFFIDRQIWLGGTGYFCIRPIKQKPPPWVEERDPQPVEGPPGEKPAKTD